MEKTMHHVTISTKEKLQATVRQARINADTAQRIIRVLDGWGSKQFTKRFADTLRAELGEGYDVYYSKYYNDWRLTVRAAAQSYDEGVTIYLGKHPMAAECRRRAERYATGLDADHIRATLLELADYGEICAEAARIALEIRAMRAKYGKYDGSFTYTMRKEIRRILETGWLPPEVAANRKEKEKEVVNV
jgi:hypothetical protein